MDKALILARVSTYSQDVKQQTEAVKAAAQKANYTVPENYIIEDVESGVLLTEEERNGLNKMKSLIEQDPEIKAVFVFELSRLSRRVEVVFSIRDYLQKKKVQLIILKPELRVFNENWEVDMGAQMIFTFLAGWAEFGGYNRKARVKRGKDRLKAQGKKYGGSHLIGFTVDKEKNIIPEPKETEMVSLIFSLYLGGGSYGSIAEELKRRGYKKRSGGLYDKDQVGSIMRNPEYYKRGLITEEEFNKCREKAKKAVQKPIKDYSGIACLCRGLVVKREKGKKEQRFLSHKAYGGYVLREGGHGHVINFELLDSFIWDFTKWYIKKRLTDPEEVYKRKGELESQILNLKAEIQTREGIIEENRQKIERCEERYIEGKWGKEKIEKMENSFKVNIENEQKAVDIAKTRLNELEGLVDSIEESGKIKLAELNKITDPQEKARLIKETVEEIEFMKSGRKGESFICVVVRNFGIGYNVKLKSGVGRRKKEVFWWGIDENGNDVLKEIDWSKDK